MRPISGGQQQIVDFSDASIKEAHMAMSWLTGYTLKLAKDIIGRMGLGIHTIAGVAAEE